MIGTENVEAVVIVVDYTKKKVFAYSEKGLQLL